MGERIKNVIKRFEKMGYEVRDDANMGNIYVSLRTDKGYCVMQTVSYYHIFEPNLVESVVGVLNARIINEL